MATAPTPGGSRVAAAKTIRITVRGDTATVNPADLGPRDDALVRKETKMAGVERVSLMGAISQLDEQSMGLDAVCLLWWLGRRKAGDTTMSFGDALDRFPTYATFFDDVTFEVEDDDDDPEDGSPEG